MTTDEREAESRCVRTKEVIQWTLALTLRIEKKRKGARQEFALYQIVGSDKWR